MHSNPSGEKPDAADLNLTITSVVAAIGVVVFLCMLVSRSPETTTVTEGATPTQEQKPAEVKTVDTMGPSTKEAVERRPTSQQESDGDGPSQPLTRERVLKTLEDILSPSKQAIFNYYHPVGTAKRISVHNAEVKQDAGGGPLLAIRFTLFWEGPITTDGYTKILWEWDPENNQNSLRILATNGITNEDAGNLAIQVGAAVLTEIVRQEMSSACQ